MSTASPFGHSEGESQTSSAPQNLPTSLSPRRCPSFIPPTHHSLTDSNARRPVGVTEPRPSGSGVRQRCHVGARLASGQPAIRAAFHHLRLRPTRRALPISKSKRPPPNQFSVLWRTPVLAGMRLPIVLRYRRPAQPEGALRTGTHRFAGGTPMDRRRAPVGWRVSVSSSLACRATITDVLVRVEMLNGGKVTTIVHASQPWIDIAATQTWLGCRGRLHCQGIRHILFGADHMLFVLGLLLHRAKPLDAAENRYGVHRCTQHHRSPSRRSDTRKWRWFR